MPGCSAVNCSNSSVKGFLMRRFPKNEERRRQWLIKMKRDNWKPTDNSCLCEVHFAPEMWEKTRVDGTRKLKANAVPTIFFFSPPPAPKRRPPRQRLPVLKPATEDATTAEIVTMENLSEEVNLPSATHQPVIQSESPTDTQSSSTASDENVENLKLVEKVARYERLYRKEHVRALKYKRSYKNACKKIKLLTTKTVSAGEGAGLFRKLFNDDQITALRKKELGRTTKLMKWSNSTVTKALKLRFSCGGTGYQQLIKQGYPFPSIRTLQRRLQNLSFDSGVLTEVFRFLEIKAQTFNEHERDCVLVLDEAAITPGRQYDTSLNKYFGDITLLDHAGIATHVLVFMLGGINTRWKQVVAYYFTGDSVNGGVFSNIITVIFENAQKIGLNIMSVTSDMGACNQALWRTWGIRAGRHSETNFKIPHPLEPTSKSVYVFADVPHLFKNIKAMFISNKIIRLPEDICERNNLQTNEVRAQHLFELVSLQQNFSFMLTPKLSEEDLLPSHFDKMKVGKSTNVINHTVSSALKFLAVEMQKSEYLSTAFFLDQVEKWFYLMTSRHPSSALSKFNESIYNDNITFLNDFIDLFQRMEVGYKRSWKPAQTGVLITTNAMLELHKVLLDEKNYEFVLTSRFSQDCLENLFSVLRSKQLVPNALQVKNNLKLISVAQYLKEVSTSSYSEDDRVLLEGFLDTLPENKPAKEEIALPIISTYTSLNLNSSELNSLYNICGYIINSIRRTSKVCENCISSVGSKRPLFKKFTQFVRIKRFKEESLFFVSEEVFHFFLEMENLFRKYHNTICKDNVNIKTFYRQEMQKLPLKIPDCHNMKNKIINRYIIFRLKIYYKKTKRKGETYSSKSIAGHAL